MKIKNLLICLIIITIYSCSNSDKDFGRVIQEPKKPENPLELYVYHLIELSYFLDQFKLYHKENGEWISKFGDDFYELEFDGSDKMGYKAFPKDERLAEEPPFNKFQESQSLSFIDFPFFNSQFLNHEKMNLMQVLKLLKPDHHPLGIIFRGVNYDLGWRLGYSPAYQWQRWADLQEIMKELKKIVSNLESLSNEILSEDFNESIKLDLHNRQVNTQIVDFEHGVQDTLYHLGGSLNNNRFYPFDADGIITALQHQEYKKYVSQLVEAGFSENEAKLKADRFKEYDKKKLDYTLPNNNINDLSNSLAALKKPYDVINKDDVFTFSKNLTVERVDQFANNLGIIVEEVKSWKTEDIMPDLIGQTFTGSVSGMGHQLKTSCQITVYEYEGSARFEVNYSVTSFSGNTKSSIEKYEENSLFGGVKGRNIVKFKDGTYGVSFPVKALTQGGVEYGKGSNVTIFINTKGNLQFSLGNNNHSYNAVADVSSSRLFEMLTKINE